MSHHILPCAIIHDRIFTVLCMVKTFMVTASYVQATRLAAKWSYKKTATLCDVRKLTDYGNFYNLHFHLKLKLISVWHKFHTTSNTFYLSQKSSSVNTSISKLFVVYTPSGSAKCLIFGHWLTLCTHFKYFTYLLTCLLHTTKLVSSLDERTSFQFHGVNAVCFPKCFDF